MPDTAPALRRLTFLGSGTSTGTPVLLCRCPVCRSADPRDTRLRASALVEYADGRSLLIDCGPDLREQLLRQGSPRLDALLVTHTHYDHVGGIDDLRPYCYKRPADDPFPVYCRADVAADLRARVPYCFAKNHYPGAPTFALHEVAEGTRFEAAGLPVEALAVRHGRAPILGYRFGRLAYVTDASALPDATVEALRGVDTLVINALRHHPHMAHMTLREALAMAERIGPRRTFLTHMCHQIGFHAAASRLLPEDVAFAYDGLTVDF